MVKIRLFRVGRKKQPYFRIVAADSRNPRNGSYIEILGHYNPRTEPPTVKLDSDRVKYWLSKGAQPTESMGKLLVFTGIKEKVTYPEKAPKAEENKAE